MHKVRLEPLIQLPREAWLLAGFSFLLALCVPSHTCVRTHMHTRIPGWRGPCARVTSAVTPVLAAALTIPGLLFPWRSQFPLVLGFSEVHLSCL